jgi:hypothetical protein
LDGLVRDLHFAYGGATERGMKLLTLDTSETLVRLRDTQSAETKARQHRDERRD